MDTSPLVHVLSEHSLWLYLGSCLAHKDAYMFVSTSLGSGVYPWVDGEILDDLNLHLYVSMKFLNTPQLVCVTFSKKKQQPYFKKEGENICLGIYCRDK